MSFLWRLVNATDLIAKRESTHLGIVFEPATQLVSRSLPRTQSNLSMQSKFVPITSSRAITDIPFFAKGGGFLDFLFVPFCRECNSAPKAGECQRRPVEKLVITH